MTTPAEQSIDVLATALDQAGDVLGSVPADTLSAPTPCRGWDVAGLMAHLVAGPRNFVLMASGGRPDWSTPPSLPEDWVGEFRSGADDLLRLWREAGESASPQSVDWQTLSSPSTRGTSRGPPARRGRWSRRWPSEGSTS